MLQGYGGRGLLHLPHFPFLSLPLQLRNLITDPSRHKLLIFAGPCIEETGELVLQMGSFSLRDFIQVFADKEVRLSLTWSLNRAARRAGRGLAGSRAGCQKVGLVGKAYWAREGSG